MEKVEELEPSSFWGCCLCVSYAHFKPFTLILRRNVKLPQGTLKQQNNNEVWSQEVSVCI